MCNCNCNCNAKTAPEPEVIPCLTCDCATAADCVLNAPEGDAGTGRKPGESEDPYGWDPRVEDEPCDGTCDTCVAANREFLVLTDLALDTFIRLLDSDNDVVAALAAERVREFAVELADAIA